MAWGSLKRFIPALELVARPAPFICAADHVALTIERKTGPAVIMAFKALQSGMRDGIIYFQAPEAILDVFAPI